MTVIELKLNLSVVTKRYLIEISANGEGILSSFDGAMQV